ncbi:MAG: hypothetical protein LAP40_16440 [Acidobacteriia bacterium]|nr:hypothetical protein [Terriglobia bacterium]
MAERFDLMNKLIDAILSRSDSAPAADPELASLARLAMDLRDLPSDGFKQRLREDLKRRASMSTTAVSPVREGFHTITPYLVVHQGAELIEFMKQAFGAEETFRSSTPGGFHAEVRIGDSMLMIGSAPSTRPLSLATLHYFVQNPDEVYHRCLRLGGTSLFEPLEDYGERFAGIQDPSGNTWIIARSLDTPSYRPEGRQDVNLFFNPVGGPQFIDFLKRAFDAETLVRYDSPEGGIVHAKLRVAECVLEIGDARAGWAPATMIMMYVPDSDALYRQALVAGATSLAEPADLPYGRSSGVTDPAGHQWYFCTPPGPRETSA